MMANLVLRKLTEWDPKKAGEKPTKLLLEEAASLTKPDTEDQIVVAMALRSSGVTGQQIAAVLGHSRRKLLALPPTIKVVYLHDWQSGGKRLKLVSRFERRR